MTILGLLQNQWFKNPKRAAAIYASHGINYDRIAQLNRAYLFMGSRTGQNLQTAFGDEWCDKIIWWESSPEKAGESRIAFPPNPRWIAKGIRHFKPEVVIAFGAIAKKGINIVTRMILKDGEDDFDVLYAPHPTARFRPNLGWELLEAKNLLMKRLTLRNYSE